MCEGIGFSSEFFPDDAAVLPKILHSFQLNVTAFLRVRFHPAKFYFPPPNDHSFSLGQK
jgi:hypothetical protein